jgi:hypothetical protein
MSCGKPLPVMLWLVVLARGRLEPHILAGMHGTVASRRIVVCLSLLIVVAIPVALIDSMSTRQVFANFGAAKRITLPLAYLLFACAALLPSKLRREGPRVRLTAWVVMPAIGIILSLLGTAFLPPLPSTTSDVLQGIALFVGFSFFAWFGLGATDWTQRQRNALLWLLLAGAVIAGALGRPGVTPLMTLTIPGFFAALVMLIRSPGQRGRYLLITLVLGVMVVLLLRPSSSGNPVSSAVVGQAVVCAAVVFLLFIPHSLRPPLIFLAVSAALFLFIQRGYYTLLTGQYFSTDVTIDQRVFEARTVLDLLSTTTWGQLMGFGPGATVDLTAAPDAGTLAASGRDLLAVDDVHLLSAYLLLKLGAFGIIWSLLLFRTAWKAALPAFGPSSTETTWRMILVLYVAAGAVNALPAATNLLANPLVPILLGVLWAARDHDGKEAAALTRKPAAILRPVS